jgi:hypothetical protein
VTSLPLESPYSQAPLDLTGSTFRLVELQPRGPTDLIKCRLTTHALPPDCPSFVALSYMWDHISPKDTIELNGTLVLIGHSLWTFLDEMRSQKRFRTYWIDAICIDQSNVQERNHQVQLMKNIYSKAESVSIWLGPADEGSFCIEAMEILRDMENWLDCNGFTLFVRGESGIEQEIILALCQNKYWERMWIFQEVVLACEATIYFGPWNVRLDVLRSMILNMKYSGDGNIPWTGYDETERVRLSLVSNLLLYRSLGLGRSVLHLAMWYCRDRKATYVRDKIYGLLGVMGEDFPGLEVDYRIKLMDLWTKVFAYLCRRTPEQLTPLIIPAEELGKMVAEALDLEISDETIIEFIEAQYALYGKPSELSDTECGDSRQ